jgi:hypothetical protein
LDAQQEASISPTIIIQQTIIMKLVMKFISRYLNTEYSEMMEFAKGGFLKSTIKINPYKIGMNLYIILIIYVVTFIGCDVFEKYQDKKYIKRTAQQILETPNLIQNEKSFK